MATVTARLLSHQYEFCADFGSYLLALVGGFGSGKTRSLCLKAILLASKNVGFTGAIFAPTFTLASDVLVPCLMDLLTDELNLRYEYKSSPQPQFTIYFPNGKTVLLVRSFENWQRLRSYNLAFALVDELDTVEPLATAWKAWKLLLARVRVGNCRQIAVTTTPEGYRLCWEVWVKESKPGRRMIQASTRDNPFLPPEYIESLYEHYDEALVKAYVEGQFVNLAQGRVYRSYDRRLNGSDELPLAGDLLHIGVDFNVGAMAAIVGVLRFPGYPHRATKIISYPSIKPSLHIVDELVDCLDTPDLIATIQERYPEQWEAGQIWVYPDASGKQRHSSDASESDLYLFKQAGFKVKAPNSNPRVRDRVLAVNSAFCNAKGERRLRANPDRCPRLVEALERQVYDDGEPDKSSGLDHILDALGYLVFQRLPLISRRVQASGIEFY